MPICTNRHFFNGLLARAEQVNDLDLLRRVLKAATAADIDELNKLLP
jgi:hypothetical protein